MALAPVAFSENERRQLAVELAAHEFRRRSDLLAHVQFSSWTQYWFAEYVSRGIETYWRSSNQGGKTFGAALLFVALAMGRSNIGTDGDKPFHKPVALPPVPQPSTFVCLTKSYDAQVLGPQKAILELLGDWPHHVSWERKSDGIAKTIWILPAGAPASQRRNFTRWSRIVFRCEQSAKRSLPGGRIDGAWADEPPDMSAWRELRSRTIANQYLFLGISATPIWREDWDELEEDFRECQNAPKDGRVELRSKLTDNTALSKRHVKEQLAKWKNDPHKDARITGEYVDVEGRCPFRYKRLAEIERLCRVGRTYEAKIRAALDLDDGLSIEELDVQFQEWEPPLKTEKFAAFLDPAQGIDDRQHDPSCIHVYRRNRPMLVARYNGYLDSYGSGWLLAVLSARFNRCPVDIEMNGGFGRSAVHGYRDARAAGIPCGPIMSEVVEIEGNKVKKRLGWTTNNQNRGEFVAECQAAVETGSIRFYSLGVVETFRGIGWHKGKLVARLPKHDEDMILMGRAGVAMKQLRIKPEVAEDIVARRQRKAIERIRSGRRPGYKGPRPR